MTEKRMDLTTVTRLVVRMGTWIAMAVLLMLMIPSAVDGYQLLSQHEAAQVEENRIKIGSLDNRVLTTENRVAAVEDNIKDLKALQIEKRLATLEAVQATNSNIILGIAGGVVLLLIGELVKSIRPRGAKS